MFFFNTSEIKTLSNEKPPSRDFPISIEVHHWPCKGRRIWRFDTPLMEMLGGGNKMCLGKSSREVNHLTSLKKVINYKVIP